VVTRGGNVRQVFHKGSRIVMAVKLYFHYEGKRDHLQHRGGGVTVGPKSGKEPPGSGKNKKKGQDALGVFRSGG